VPESINKVLVLKELSKWSSFLFSATVYVLTALSVVHIDVKMNYV